jgi:hypothetical protein
MLFLDVKYFSLKDLANELGININSDYEYFLSALSLIKHPDFEAIKLFIAIQNEQTRVYNGWIEQQKSVKQLLISGTTSEYFNDNYNWLQHALFGKFKSYISPFFVGLIQRKHEVQINAEWAKIFSYFELMDDEMRFYIEQSLYQSIKATISEKLAETTKNTNEGDFHQILLFLLSDDSIAIHNSLSRSSHALKISFVEQILQLFYHSKCSAKLAHWMILRLEKMNLNKEQNQSLDLIKLKIKNGEIEFSNIDMQKNPSKLRNVFLLVCFAFVLGLLFYLYNQEYVVNIQNFQEASSLSAFSIEERKEIDSLLKSIPTEQADSTVETYYSSGNTISIQTPIKNKLAEKIYKEFELDMTNHFMRLYDTCIPLSKDKIKKDKINQTQNLDRIKANSELEFKNNSEYTFILLAWVESENGEVFSGLISKKSTFKMTASTNMKLVLIPGNEYGSIPSKNKSDFSYLTHHFCSIDFNYEFALQQIHTIDVANTKLSKILLDGALGEVIVLTDVDGILN